MSSIESLKTLKTYFSIFSQSSFARHEAMSAWKSGSCRFRCALCPSSQTVLSNTLELASHLRGAHGLDMEAYVRAHGHSRVETRYVDCAMCAESVMHDLVRKSFYGIARAVNNGIKLLRLAV